MRSSGAPAVLVLVSIAFSLVACRCPMDFTTRKPGVPLLGHFLSFSSLEEVRRGQLSGAHLVLVEETTCRKADPNPCFQIVVWETAFNHLGVAGQLWLTFFNDRLYATTFFPADPDRYLQQLAQSGLRLPRSSEPLELSRDSLAWSDTTDDHRHYVAWIDRRLLAENAKWIKCYGKPGDRGSTRPQPPVANSQRLHTSRRVASNPSGPTTGPARWLMPRKMGSTSGCPASGSLTPGPMPPPGRASTRTHGVPRAADWPLYEARSFGAPTGTFPVPLVDRFRING